MKAFATVLCATTLMAQALAQVPPLRDERRPTDPPGSGRMLSSTINYASIIEGLANPSSDERRPTDPPGAGRRLQIDPRWEVELCIQARCEREALVNVLERANVLRAGGGDIIGNGGGLAEQNFVYALAQLSDFIAETMAAGLVKEDDARTLAKIGELAKAKKHQAHELIFISGKLIPGLFHAGHDSEVRLAKTGLSPEAPILVNLDLLYDRRGVDLEIMPLPIMVASLVHELGHQVGIEDHSYLDFLGSRVRRLLEREQVRVSRTLGSEGRVVMTSINLGRQTIPRLSATVGTKLVSFDAQLSDALRCSNEGDFLLGARLENHHFQSATQFPPHWIVPFRAWASLTCMNSESGQVRIEERDLVVDLLIDLSASVAVSLIQFRLN